MLVGILIGLVGSAALTALFAAAQVGVARLFGSRATRVKLFVGPVVRRGKLEIHLLPLPSYSADFDAKLEQLNRFARCAAQLAGPFSTALVAVVLLGPGDAGQALANAPAEIIGGAFAPFTSGAGMLEHFYTLGPLAQLGVLAATLTVWNLLPFPGSAGLLTVLSLFGVSRNTRANLWLFLLMLVLIGGWLLAFVTSVGILPTFMQGALGVAAVALLLGAYVVRLAFGGVAASKTSPY